MTGGKIPSCCAQAPKSASRAPAASHSGDHAEPDAYPTALEPA